MGGGFLRRGGGHSSFDKLRMNDRPLRGMGDAPTLTLPLRGRGFLGLRGRGILGFRRRRRGLGLIGGGLGRGGIEWGV